MGTRLSEHAQKVHEKRQKGKKKKKKRFHDVFSVQADRLKLPVIFDEKSETDYDDMPGLYQVVSSEDEVDHVKEASSDDASEVEEDMDMRGCLVEFQEDVVHRIMMTKMIHTV